MYLGKFINSGPSEFYMQLPTPSNKTVGCCTFSLFDASRKEFFDQTQQRQFEVLAWYPALDTQGELKPYLPKEKIKNIFFLKYHIGIKKASRIISGIKTNSLIEVPVSSNKDKYPVLLFSHDIGMLPEYYTVLMEHLASEGYFVFSINHTHLAESSTVYCTKKNNVTHTTFKKRIALISKIYLMKVRKSLVGKSYDEKWTTSRLWMDKWRDLRDIHAEMALDKKYLIDFLSQLITSNQYKDFPYAIFSASMDLTKIGVIGHGWGGSSAVHALVTNEKISAAVNLDGFQFAHANNVTITKPLLTIYSKKYASINDGIYFSSSTNEQHTVDNSSHNCFTDWTFYSRKHYTGQAVLQETLNLTLGFFNKHLKKRIDQLQPPQIIMKGKIRQGQLTTHLN